MKQQNQNPFKQFKAISITKYNLGHKPPFLVYPITLVLGAGLMVTIAHSGSLNTEAYKKAEIKGIVQKVEGYTRNAPILIINGKRVIIDGIPLIEFDKYVLPGDSLVKRSGTEAITTYRNRNSTTEVIEWKYTYNEKWQQFESGITKHYLPKK